MAKKKEKEANLLDLVVTGMQEKKAQEITIIDLKNIKGAVADYFVICSAGSDTQADAISLSVEEEVWKGSKENPWHKEGFQNKEWILLDYSDVVVHIFKKERRQFYALEDLWGDADITIIDDNTAEPVLQKKKVVKEPEVKEVAKKTSKTVTRKKPAPKSKTVAKSTDKKKAVSKKVVSKKTTKAKKK